MNTLTENAIVNCEPAHYEPQIFVEQTLALIKPNATDKLIEIEDIILRAGFTILKVSQPSVWSITIALFVNI